MNDTVQMILTVLFAILAIWSILILFLKGVQETREAEARDRESRIERIPITHQYPDGTRRRIS